MSYINEHGAITIKSFPNIFITLATLVFIFILGNNKVRLSDLFMLAGLFFLSFLSNRSTSLFYLLSLYSTGRIFKGFINKRLLMIKIDDAFLMPVVYVAFMLIFLVGCPCYYFLSIRKDFYINEEIYPVDIGHHLADGVGKRSSHLSNVSRSPITLSSSWPSAYTA